MKSVLQWIRREFLTKQFIVFLIIGGINTINGMLVPLLLSVFLQMNLAYVISYIPNLAISYVLNSIFTFHDKNLSFKSLLKFYISYLPNFIIQNVVFALVYNLIGLPKIYAVVAASAIGLPVTFIILKYFTFSKQGKDA